MMSQGTPSDMEGCEAMSVVSSPGCSKAGLATDRGSSMQC